MFCSKQGFADFEEILIFLLASLAICEGHCFQVSLELQIKHNLWLYQSALELAELWLLEQLTIDW